MEQEFLKAREGTEDPVGKVILTGMWQDFMNFKREKWGDSFRMLAEQGR